MIIHFAHCSWNLGAGYMYCILLDTRRPGNNIVVTSMYFTDNADGQTCYNFAKLVTRALYF